MMLLHRPRGTGSVGREELARRAGDFAHGRFSLLLRGASRAVELQRCTRDAADTFERRGRAAQSRVEAGQVSRARQELVGASLAPKTQATLDELQGKRPTASATDSSHCPHIRPQTSIAVGFQPLHKISSENAPSGRSPGLGGCSNEMWRVCLDDYEVFQLLFRAAEDFARADVPDGTRVAFMSATMTALQKPDGGVRGVATGTSFRRLVAKTLARQFSKRVEATCVPFQFALSTRAGTDCVGHAIRALTDADPTATVLSMDGIGAYDHVLRSAMMSKLHDVPCLRGLLPFVRATYAQPTEYLWEDAAGVRHTIRQAEGGEQGDPLMPLLFSLGIHDSLVEVHRNMQPGEHLLAFLDDVRVVSPPGRTRPMYNVLDEKLEAGAGIRLHAGKTRVWNRASMCPPNVVDLGAEVWNPEGIKILGTPVGSRQFVHEKVMERVDEERRLWEAIPHVPDLQCAWQILLQLRGTALPPHVAHVATNPVRRVRTGA